MSFINKITGLQPNNQKSEVPTSSKTATDKVQEAIAEKFGILIEDVLNDQASIDKKMELLSKGSASAPELISSASNKAMGISGVLNLAPGPWGLIAIVPELIAVLRIQIVLVRDLSIAYGYKEKLNKDLLTYLIFSSLGGTGIALATMHGAQILVKRPGLRVAQKVVAVLAGKVSQSVAKAALGKWIPIIGAGVLAVWTRYSTQEIGRICCELLEKEIVLTDEVLEDETIVLDSSPENPVNVKLESFKIMTNLALVDGINVKEYKYLFENIKSAGFTNEDEEILLNALAEDKQFEINFELFQNEFDRILLFENLNQVSNIDGVVSDKEKVYIQSVKDSLITK